MKTEEVPEQVAPEQKEVPGTQAGALQGKAAGAAQDPGQEEHLITEILPPEGETEAGETVRTPDILSWLSAA